MDLLIPYLILFCVFGLPLISLALFFVSLFRYRTARKKNRKVPGTIAEEEMKKRKTALIAFSAVAAVFVAAFITIAILFALSIKYM